MENLGVPYPVLTTASRAERATMRAAREMARREAEQEDPRPGRVALDDGLAMTARQFERLTGVHRTAYQRSDWREHAQREPLPVPVRTHEREKAARRALATYQPNWQDRLLGDEATRRRQLAAKVMEAASADEAQFQKAFRAVDAENAKILLARKLLQLDPQAIKEAITQTSKLAELTETMNGVGVALPGNGRIVAVVDVPSLADMPLEKASTAGGGRRDPMTSEERRRLHLASICSTALRVGAEFVSVLPLGAVEVVVECDLSEGQRGSREPILQLLMTSALLGSLDWKCGEPVQLATSVGARLDWSVEKGFVPIRPIALSAMGQPLAKTA